jgi:hypothetical protein
MQEGMHLTWDQFDFVRAGLTRFVQAFRTVDSTNR